ncbi:RxLR effector protein [Phytophthora megakarya]|uniref:RxLR effector protein n=1 Tax=Phytophthora megakarya TaxID=4795 RepID=A0A225VLK9_9STRA|nr:RxLR effector protein [Phytophthora megakarya]
MKKTHLILTTAIVILLATYSSAVSTPTIGSVTSRGRANSTVDHMSVGADNTRFLRTGKVADDERSTSEKLNKEMRSFPRADITVVKKKWPSTSSVLKLKDKKPVGYTEYYNGLMKELAKLNKAKSVEPTASYKDLLAKFKRLFISEKSVP